MTFLGTVKGGVIVPNEPVELPEGASVRVEVLPAPADDQSTPTV